MTTFGVRERRRCATAALLVAIAGIALIGFGSGLVLDEGWADLHIDPVHFLAAIERPWYPDQFLGIHSGFSIVYESPYGWYYGLLGIAHVPAIVAQRIVVFSIYLLAATSMYIGIAGIFPRLTRFGRLSAAVAFVFNIYVAYNSQGSTPMLCTYAIVPALVGTSLAAIERGDEFRRANVAALLIFIGSGVNPPLIAMNAITVAIVMFVRLALSKNLKLETLRATRFAVAASIFALILNAYWLVPFVDFIRTAWLGGILDEAASMHDANSSFTNVFLGLSQWAIFRGDAGGAWYPWAASYATSLFRSLLALVVALSIAGIAFARNRRRQIAALLAAESVAIMLGVGYFDGDGGAAITSGFYDLLYRFVPGFQMFRSNYKWVAQSEFCIACLYGVFAFRAQIWLRARRLTARSPAGFAILLGLAALPCIAYVPVLLYKANYPGVVLPEWVAHERRLVPPNNRYRTALFPSQYLEKFAWGKPVYPIEYAELRGPVLMGYLGSATSQQADIWTKLAYRMAREGDPAARGAFRVLGIDRVLERDDLTQDQDFAFPDTVTGTDATLAHDIVTRILGGRAIRSDGPLFAYGLADAEPIFRAFERPLLGTGPSLSVPTTIDYEALPRGTAIVSADGLDANILRGAGLVTSRDSSSLDSLATTLVGERGLLVDAQAPQLAVRIATAGRYRISIASISPFAAADALSIAFDGETLDVPETLAPWAFAGTVRFAQGTHVMALPEATLRSPILVSIVAADTWRRERSAVESLVAKTSSRFVIASATRHAVRFRVERSGLYRLSARTKSLDAFHMVPGHVRILRLPGRYPASLARRPGTPLPYFPMGGVITSPYEQLPSAWYGSANTYAWNRNAATYWFLLGRNAHMSVFSSARGNAAVTMHLRVSSTIGAQELSIRVNGVRQASLKLAADPIRSTPASTFVARSIAEPDERVVDLEVRSGFNDVTFDSNVMLARTRSSRRTTAAVVAAMASDLSFLARGATQTGKVAMRLPSSARTAPQFGTLALALDNDTLSGDPSLVGFPAAGSHHDVTTVAELVGPTGPNPCPLSYRLAPLTGELLDFPLAQSLPIVPSDGDCRLLAAWLVSAPQAKGRAMQSLPTLHVRRTLTPRLPSDQLVLTASDRGQGLRRAFSRDLDLKLSAGNYALRAIRSDEVVRAVSLRERSLPAQTNVRIEVTNHSAASFDVSVTHASGPFVLRFGEAFHPEWQAMLGDRTLTHVHVDGFANGWLVPRLEPGELVRVTFAATRIFMLTQILSGASLLIALAALLATSLRRRRVNAT